MKKTYNKLVRDRIPEITMKNGGRPVRRVLGEKEYKEKLFEKLLEEAEEVRGAKKVKKDLTKELADLLEVVRAIAQASSIREEEIEKTMKIRVKERGAFKKRILLKYVIE